MSFKFGIIQMTVGDDKLKNLLNAKTEITRLSQLKTDIIMLPEFFNSPYGNQYVKIFAEDFSSTDCPTFQMIKETAALHKIYLIAGSIPEKDGTNYYNTCLVANPKGQIIAKYRKMHLFDIDLPQITYKESLTICPGNKPAYFDTPWGKIGLGICFDLRFPKLAEFYKNLECILVCYPAAFTIPTGQLHWSVLIKSLALNNQMYIATCSPARNLDASYHSYGHSMVVNPMGIELLHFQEKSCSNITEINKDECQTVKMRIPIMDSAKYIHE